MRTNYAIYRVPEPQVELTRPAGTVDVPWQRFAYRYPNGEKHNAETLLVHPQTGRVYLVTKEPLGTVSQVYRFPEPLDENATTTLEKVTDLALPGPTDQAITAGDLSPCGDALLLRMYNRLVELKLPAGLDFEQIFEATPVQVPVADEPQGEAVAWATDGRSYFTSSEKLTAQVAVNQVTRR